MSISRFELLDDYDFYQKQDLGEKGATKELARRLMIPDQGILKDTYDAVMSELLEETTRHKITPRIVANFLKNASSDDHDYLHDRAEEIESIRERLDTMRSPASHRSIEMTAQAYCALNRDRTSSNDISRSDADVTSLDASAADCLAFATFLANHKISGGFTRMEQTVREEREELLTDQPNATMRYLVARLLDKCRNEDYPADVCKALYCRIEEYASECETCLSEGGQAKAAKREQEIFPFIAFLERRLLADTCQSDSAAEALVCGMTGQIPFYQLRRSSNDMLYVQLADQSHPIDEQEVISRWCELYDISHNPVPESDSFTWAGNRIWNANYVFLCQNLGELDDLAEKLYELKRGIDKKRRAKIGVGWGIGMFLGVMQDDKTVDLYVPSGKQAAAPIPFSSLREEIASFAKAGILDALPAAWQLSHLPHDSGAWRERIIYRLALEAKHNATPGAWKNRQKTFLDPKVFEELVATPLSGVLCMTKHAKEYKKVLATWADEDLASECATPDEMQAALYKARYPKQATDAEGIVEEIEELTEEVCAKLAQVRCLHMLPTEKFSQMGLDARMLKVIADRLGGLAEAIDDARSSVEQAKSLCDDK